MIDEKLPTPAQIEQLHALAKQELDWGLADVCMAALYKGDPDRPLTSISTGRTWTARDARKFVAMERTRRGMP